MSGHEARINDALKQLGEEFRLGMIQLAEYRSRRKMLVETWGERDSTTSPRGLASKATTATMPRATMPRPAAPQKKNIAPLAIAIAALVALALGAWLVLRSSTSAKSGGSPASSVAPLSESAQAMNRSADDFLARNVWDGNSIQAFLAQWRALTPQDRARVAEGPSLRTLRSRLDQNIQAEMQLITPETKPEERTQLTMLQDFSRALAGDAQ